MIESESIFYFRRAKHVRFDGLNDSRGVISASRVNRVANELHPAYPALTTLGYDRDATSILLHTVKPVPNFIDRKPEVLLRLMEPVFLQKGFNLRSDSARIRRLIEQIVEGRHVREHHRSVGRKAIELHDVRSREEVVNVVSTYANGLGCH